MRWQILILIVFWGIVVPVSAQAQLELDLITVINGESEGDLLIWGCMSPGDWDGDGYSELFVAEAAGQQRLLMYKGGNPPDKEYDKDFGVRSARHNLIDDVNGDGYQELAIRRPESDGLEIVEIYFGGPGIYDKTEPDLTITHPDDFYSFFGESITAGDLNGDGQNDIIVGDPNAGLPVPFDGRFYIYYGGTQLDSIMDDSINIYYTHQYFNDYNNGTTLGDINGDNLEDFAYSGLSDSDYVAIILGAVPLDTLPEYEIWTPFPGNTSWGLYIASLGDLNKDGYDDFGVAGGNVWATLFYGGVELDTIPYILGDTTDIFTKGDRIENIGDINHDGCDDIGVGYTAFNFEDGIVYIYFGGPNMDTEVDITIYTGSGMRFGESIASAGDFNGDGVDDLAISSREYYMSGQFDRGRVYIFAGDPTLPTPAEDEIDNPVPKNYNILHQNYPNPFNSTTQIKYELRGLFDREVDLSIYNILGQKIRTLYKGIQSGGEYSISWDGKDDDGRNMPSGIYFYHLKSSDQRESKKMIYLK